MREVTELPEELPLLPFAEEEMRRMAPIERRIHFRRSENTFVMEDKDGEILIVIGVIQRTQVSVPEVWMLLCEGFTRNLRRNMIDLRNKVRDELLARYDKVMVKADASHKQAQRFAEFLGFEKIYHADDYIYYEVSRGIRSNSGRA